MARVPPYSRTVVPVSRTGLSPAAARLSRRFRYQRQRPLACSAFARHYWRNLTGIARATPPLMSLPPATEMFQFAGFASSSYEFRQGYPHGWVAPFGDPGITDRSHLPRAFRSVPRPSSPLSAKASTRCPCFALDHRIALWRCHLAAAHRAEPHASRNPRAGGLYEDTSFGPPRARSRPPGRSASVTSQLSLHPSINPPQETRGAVAIFSERGRLPGATALPRWCLWVQLCCTCRPAKPGFAGGLSVAHATPVARRTAGSPVVEVNGFEPMTSCLQSRRSPS